MGAVNLDDGLDDPLLHPLHPVELLVQNPVSYTHLDVYKRQGQSYTDRIAYKDNENKPIHISEFLRLMYAFDIDKYPDDNAAPVQSYSGKAQVFKRYKQVFETPFYQSLTLQLPTLVELYDIIERELPAKYKEYKKAQGVANPRFGSVRGIESLDKPARTEFLACLLYTSRCV